MPATAAPSAPSPTRLFYGDSEFCAVLRDGEIWFYAKDVCRALALRNVSQALTKLDDDEKGIINSKTAGGPQDVLLVSEAGAYRLIFVSRKPAAIAFKRWLAHEVIPSLRKAADANVFRPAAAARDKARNANRIRFAKMSLVSAALRLEDLGVDVAAISMAAVLDFGHRLKAIGARP